MAATPFPGMDPYLEDAAYWEGFHDVLITECLYQVEQALPDGYTANVRERAEVISVDDPAARVYVPDIGVVRERPPRPNAAHVADADGGVAVETELAPVTLASVDSIDVREAYIEVLRIPEMSLVTVIGLMSPWNKHGAGIGIYRSKRASLVRDGVHFVELDLLRGGTRTQLSKPLPPAEYYANVFRADRAPAVHVYHWRLRDPLPHVPVPLRAPDKDARMDLAGAVRTAYDRGRYDRKLRYARPLDPPLHPDDQAWATDLIQKSGIPARGAPPA